MENARTADATLLDAMENIVNENQVKSVVATVAFTLPRCRVVHGENHPTNTLPPQLRYATLRFGGGDIYAIPTISTLS